MTGLRHEQAVTRADLRKVEIDRDHNSIVKINPLIEWSCDQVWITLERITFHSTGSINKLTRASAAPPAAERSRREKICVPAAGGGRIRKPRNAACTCGARAKGSDTEARIL
jgi:hypothetical protein